MEGGVVGRGCAATGGYLQVLAADDDNGNINDGTPHMQAIRAATTWAVTLSGVGETGNSNSWVEQDVDG